MYFKKLEIFGFKSFAEKTVLNFEEGITAVVGPNGCGKSNVFDAIRWVLGEQSAKQLRGGAMEDVIFNGTDSRLALGFAEVSVTFDNNSKMLSINAVEVVVTRRLFRSGESEYLINREVVRLKDVVELFMGTGVGAEAYSLVQQGRVDLVVSAKPEDRRLIFDEASGITKYKSKKREAQSKLRDTDQNLLRLNDIVGEVKRQISSVERQAQKAQRYKAEYERLKELETLLARWQLFLSQKEKKDKAGLLADVRGRSGEFSVSLDDFRQMIERETELLGELEFVLQDLREKNIKLENQVDLKNRQIAFNEERLENLAENEKRVIVSKSRIMEQRRQNEARLDELTASLDVLAQEAKKSLEALEEKKMFLSQVAGSIDELQAELRSDEERMFGMSARRVDIQGGLTQNMKETQGALARRYRLEKEKEKVSFESTEIGRRIEGLSRGLLDIMARRGALAETLSAEKLSLDSKNSMLAVLTARIEDKERRKLFLISQKDFIEKLQVQYQDIPDPVIVGRFISPIAPSENHSGLIGKVKAVAEIDLSGQEGFGRSSGGIDGGRMYEIVCETKFIELDPGQIASYIGGMEKELDVLIIEKQQIVQQIGVQSGVMDRVQADLFVEDKKLSVCEAQQSDVALQAEKLGAELDLLNREFTETDQSLAKLKAEEAALQEGMGNIDEEIEAVRESVRVRQDVLANRRREREAAAVSVAQMDAEAGRFVDKERNGQTGVNMFRAELERGISELALLDKEAETFVERREKYYQEIEALRSSVEQIRSEGEGLFEDLAKHENQRNEAEQKLSSLRAQVVSMEKDSANDRELVHEYELQIQQISFREKAVLERLSQKYGINLEAPDNNEKSDADVFSFSDDFDPERVAQDVDALFKRCEGFGSVNLVAIDEFEELKERFQFLTKQQSDLLTAKDLLEQTIRKINKTTRQMFVDTFTKVNEQFRHYFRVLFNGGEAQLVLVDPENALESGIEIVARPPGKKLQTISLLSGGEKTMTAIALIFSVFKVNPSPFCVLDEIDAALDEANVDRFASVLKEFSRIAQFVVITHNKKTIAYADVMYGVTMQQTGVSRVVSVKLSEKVSSSSQVETEGSDVKDVASSVAMTDVAGEVRAVENSSSEVFAEA